MLIRLIYLVIQGQIIAVVAIDKARFQWKRIWFYWKVD